MGYIGKNWNLGGGSGFLFGCSPIFSGGEFLQSFACRKNGSICCNQLDCVHAMLHEVTR